MAPPICWPEPLVLAASACLCSLTYWPARRMRSMDCGPVRGLGSAAVRLGSCSLTGGGKGVVWDGREICWLGMSVMVQAAAGEFWVLYWGT